MASKVTVIGEFGILPTPHALAFNRKNLPETFLEPSQIICWIEQQMNPLVNDFKKCATVHTLKNKLGDFFKSEDVGIVGIKEKIEKIIKAADKNGMTVNDEAKLQAIFKVLLKRMAHFVSGHTSHNSPEDINKHLLHLRLVGEKEDHHAARMIGIILNQACFYMNDNCKAVYCVALEEAAGEIKLARTNTSDIVEYAVAIAFESVGNLKSIIFATMYPELSQVCTEPNLQLKNTES